jgi:hypothetical protein
VKEAALKKMSWWVAAGKVSGRGWLVSAKVAGMVAWLILQSQQSKDK